ncbi:hypothetical protein DPMN_033931 [Dreissena polymorpha]|uniref:Ras-associating domain-containing protein n=1 Tax=Dreissena polymorpha TaxID=45954 RepID=A0A9D4M6Y4_DREPO|nr:hypothetical protein DPMN_033931 [Dreissena polymorpha]
MMAETRRRKHVEVPLTFGDTIRYIKGVTKYTTCADVIKMVLRKLDGEETNDGTEAYGIFESSRGIERPLPAKSRLLKVMRSWGMDNDYEFVFRKVSPCLHALKMSESRRKKLNTKHRAMDKHVTCEKAVEDRLTHFSHPNEFVKELYFNGETDHSDDEFVPSVSHSDLRQAALGQSFSAVSRNVTGKSADHSFVVNANSIVLSDVNNVKFAVRKTLKQKTCTVTSAGSSNDNTEAGKVTTLTTAENPKNIKNRLRNVKRHERLASDLVSRISKMNQKEGKDALLEKYFSEYITYRSPKCKYVDSRYRGRGDGAETGEETPSVNVAGSNYINEVPARQQEDCSSAALTLHDDDNDSGHDDNGDVSNFNVAFIGDCDDFFKTEMAQTGLNSVNKLVDYSLSEDEQTSFMSDPSEISTVSYEGHNVSNVSDIVKNVFADAKSFSEDDEMESFMKTKLEDEFSDEGLSSLGSDDGREIVV